MSNPNDDIYREKYLKYKAKYLKLKSHDNSILNMVGGSTNSKTLYLFKAEWCPHCVAFKDTWNKLSNDYKNKLHFIAYDSEKNADEIRKYKIDGFPTLILMVNNKAIEYVGPRDEKSLKEFIDQYI